MQTKPDKSERAPTSVGVNLKLLREAQDLTQAALAEKAGINQEDISRIERFVTQDPSVSIVHAVANSLGCTVEELMAETTGESPVDAFFDSDLGRRLNLKENEKRLLSRTRWFPDGCVPTDVHWFDFVRLWRSVYFTRPRLPTEDPPVTKEEFFNMLDFMKKSYDAHEAQKSSRLKQKP
jgi:transcriptional regulator with XRE-family HTH domain